MSITSYSELQTAVANWLNRADLALRIPEFISLAEAQMKRDKRVQTKTVVTLTLASPGVTLPADFHEMVALYFDGDGSIFGGISIVAPDKVAWAKRNGTGVPRVAAITDDGTTLYLGPEPDTSRDATLEYIATFAVLSDTNTTNFILDDHHDIYLNGALKEAEPFLKNDERVQLWETKYEKAMTELGRFIDRRRFGGAKIIRPRRAIG